MPKEKTATKTARSPVNGAEIPLGAHPGNTGGKKGRSGRTPDEFKRMCQELASSESVRSNVLKILASPADYPGLYVGALKWATEHGYGKPTETMKIDAPEGTTMTQVWTFGKRQVAF